MEREIEGVPDANPVSDEAVLKLDRDREGATQCPPPVQTPPPDTIIVRKDPDDL